MMRWFFRVVLGRCEIHRIDLLERLGLEFYDRSEYYCDRCEEENDPENFS